MRWHFKSILRDPENNVNDDGVDNLFFLYKSLHAYFDDK